jgi:hypothetical protein
MVFDPGDLAAGVDPAVRVGAVAVHEPPVLRDALSPISQAT